MLAFMNILLNKIGTLQGDLPIVGSDEKVGASLFFTSMVVKQGTLCSHGRVTVSHP
jgi:hypothetical protein